MKQLLSKIKFKSSGLIKKRPELAGLFLIVVCAALVGAGYYIYNSYKTRQYASVDCQTVVKNTEKLLDQKKYAEARTLVEKNSKACIVLPKTQGTSDVNKGDSIIDNIHYEAELARAASYSGDNEQAKIHAQKVLDNNKQLSEEQRQKIQNSIGIYSDMYTILDGEKLFRPDKPVLNKELQDFADQQ